MDLDKLNMDDHEHHLISVLNRNRSFLLSTFPGIPPGSTFSSIYLWEYLTWLLFTLFICWMSID